MHFQKKQKTTIMILNMPRGIFLDSLCKQAAYDWFFLIVSLQRNIVFNKNLF
jgi:hypothetical protein